MNSSHENHPVLRHFGVLFCALGGAATVVLSGLVNPHSMAWLLSVYATTALLFVARRKLSHSPLLRPYCLYLFWMNQYMLLVWFLHVWVPGPSYATTAHQVLFWAHVLGAGSIVVPAAIYHFTLRLSKVTAWPLRAIEYAAWPLVVVMTVAQFTGDFTREYIWAQYTWVPKVEALYTIYFIYTSLFILMICVIPVVKAARTDSHEHRLQLFYYALGMIPLLLTCWVNFLLSLGYKLYPAGGIFFLLHVLIMGYAVLVRRAFDITFAVRRGLAYAFVSVLLAVVYPLLFWLGSRSSADAASAGTIGLFGLALLTGLFYAPLHSVMQRFVDRIFFRHTPDRQQLLQSFIQSTAATSSATASAGTGADLVALSESISGAISAAFQPGSISVYINDAGGEAVLFGTFDTRFTTADWPVGARLPQDIASRAASGAVRLRVDPPAAAAQPLALTTEFESLLVPIDHHNQRLGFFVLAPKRADEPYDAQDIAYATAVVTHYSMALSNARALAQLEHWKSGMTRMIEGMAAGIVMTSRAGVIARMNSAAQQLLAPDRSVPRILDDLKSANPAFAAIISAALLERREFRNREVTLSGSPMRTALASIESVGMLDDQEFFVVCINDITDYKRLENDARKKESLVQVGSYVSSINHELLNQLQPLQHQVLQLSKTSTVYGDALSKISTHTLALQQTLKTLKDVARPIDLRLRRLEVRTMIEAVLLDIGAQPFSVGTRLTCEIPDDGAHCTADGHWLRQVLYNLVKNAAESCFGCDGAAVCVSAVMSGQELSIVVRDSGPGMDEGTQRQLFQPFFSTKSNSGTGLGLCISKKIVELHGGRIDVASAPGQGAAFMVLLPIEQRAAVPS